MNSSNTSLTILHVEDDPALVNLVQAAFEGFGFRGGMISEGGVNEALDLLDRCGRNGEHVDLILVDMQLPDGSGLDVLREVKADPVWQMTPVIVLSSETAAGTINGAYALGANCYLPKISRTKGPFDMLRALYECWLKDAFLPRPHFRDRLHNVLTRALRLRARCADFYIRLAGTFEGKPEEMGFWLERALNEGNLSNLLVFFRNTLSEKDVTVDTINRVDNMQVRVRKALRTAENRLKRTPVPGPAEVCRWVLDLTDALDEEVIAESLACLFPKSPVAAAALKARAASQIKSLGDYVLEKCEDEDLRQRARLLLGWAERLAMGADACS